MRHHAPSSVAVTAGGMPIAGTVPMGVGSVGAAPVPTYPLVPPIRQNGHGSGRPNVLSMESGLEMTSSSTIAATGSGSVQSSGGGGGGGGTIPIVRRLGSVTSGICGSAANVFDRSHSASCFRITSARVVRTCPFTAVTAIGSSRRRTSYEVT